jgi:PAT family beta-lactamase induction signal transducer AmpG
MLPKINKKFINLLILGVISGIPMSLVTSTLQAWFTDSNISLKAIAAYSLVGLPQVYRWLWAPLLDRFTFFKLPRRKAWMLISQIGIVILLFLLSYLNPVEHLRFVFFIALLIAIFSTTQDMAIDAQRIEYLDKQDHGLGAAFGSLGYRIGMLISGAFTIVFATQVGWQIAYQVTAAFLGVLSVLAFFIPEQDNALSSELHIFKFAWNSLVSLFKLPKLGWMLLFIFLYKLADIFTAPLSGIRVPFIIYGLGYSLPTLAYVNKFFGTIALIGGGVAAGLLMRKYSLYRLLAIFGVFQIISNAIFLHLSYHHETWIDLAFAIVWDDAISGMSSTALVALMMRYVNQENTATQFAWLITFASIPRIMSGPLSVWLQQMYSWHGLYICGIGLSLLFIPILFKINKI